MTEYPPGAGALRYGNAAGDAIIAGHRPLAGNLYYRVGLSSATPNAPTILFVGAGPGVVPLDGVGMTGCQFLIDPSFFLVLRSTKTKTAGWPAVCLGCESLFLLTRACFSSRR